MSNVTRMPTDLPRNAGHEFDVRYPCGVCGADSGESCKAVKKLTPDMVRAGYVHFGRRVRRLLRERS